VVFIYGIGRLLKNEATGLIAAVLWAAFPLDILQATQVYPDSIAAALTSGAVFSLLLAFRHSGVKRFVLFALMSFLLLWTFYVKQLGMLTALFCMFYIAWHYSEKWLRQIFEKVRTNKQFRQKIIVRTSLLMIIFVSIATFAIQFPEGQAFNLIAANATDTIQFILMGNPPYEFTETLPRAKVFDLFTPLFLVSLFMLWIRKERSAPVLLSWLAILFIFSEWGASFRLDNLPIIYQSPNPILQYDRRHVLFMLVPLLLTVAFHLSNGVKKKVARLAVPGIAMIVSFLWLVYRKSIYMGQIPQILEILLTITLMASILSPLWGKLIEKRSWGGGGCQFALTRNSSDGDPCPNS